MLVLLNCRAGGGLIHTAVGRAGGRGMYPDEAFGISFESLAEDNSALAADFLTIPQPMKPRNASQADSVF
jgi:hypothetical protein